jgi:hypothetical protein
MPWEGGRPWKRTPLLFEGVPPTFTGIIADTSFLLLSE